MIGEAERWLSTAYPYLHQEYQLATPPPSPPTITCLICCLRPHSGLHYGLHTCEADKQFLKRTFHERIIYERCLEGTCIPRPRGWCQYCRLRRCLISGVNLNLVRVGEARVRRGTKRTRDPLPLSAEGAHHQIPQMYHQHPSQVLYQPYHPFLPNQTDKFWINPPANPMYVPPISFHPSNATTYTPISLVGSPFSITPAPASATPYVSNSLPEYGQSYVGPQQKDVQKESDHWYKEELANFMHFPRNDQFNRPQQSPPIMAFLRPNVEVKQPGLESTQLQPFQYPKLEMIDELEELPGGQNNLAHQQEEFQYGQKDLACQQEEFQYGQKDFACQQEEFRYGQKDLACQQEEPTYGQHELPYDHNSANEQEELAYQQSQLEQLQKDLNRPIRSSSNKSYGDNLTQEFSKPLDLSSITSPIDLSSLASPIDLSSPSSHSPSVIPRPASVESFGPSRPSSTGSIGLSRPPSAGSSSRPPSLPGILEMSGNNKFSVNSMVLQDALEKVQANISIANFANISNLSGVLEASCD